mgnify:CR=1 FL=1
MNTDTMRIVADTIANSAQQKGSLNWWMIIAIIELVVIIILLVEKNRKLDKRHLIKEQVKQEGDIDWNNTVGSMFGAESLYQELIRKCHPDRFPGDEEKIAIANDITERIGKYKHNLQKLKELKEEAIAKLNISL